MRVLAKVLMAVVVVLMLFVAFGFLATYGAVQFIERHPITPAPVATVPMVPPTTVLLPPTACRLPPCES